MKSILQTKVSYDFFGALLVNLNHFHPFLVGEQFGNFKSRNQTTNVVEKDPSLEVGRIA